MNSGASMAPEGRGGASSAPDHQAAASSTQGCYQHQQADERPQRPLGARGSTHPVDAASSAAPPGWKTCRRDGWVASALHPFSGSTLSKPQQ